MPTDLIAWFANNLNVPVLIVLLAWAIFKDKPLLVLGRSYRELEDRLKAQEAKTELYLKLILKSNDQANSSTRAAKEVLTVVGGKEAATGTGRTGTGGRVGNKGQRQADVDETD